MNREVMKQALDFLEALQGGCTDSDDGTVEAITVHCPEIIVALRAALDAPEPEPVAWRYRGNLHEFDPSDWAEGPVTPLYLAPREWQGLTDEELKAVFEQNWDSESERPSVPFAYERAIEAKLKEKNT